MRTDRRFRSGILGVVLELEIRGSTAIMRARVSGSLGGPITTTRQLVSSISAYWNPGSLILEPARRGNSVTGVHVQPPNAQILVAGTFGSRRNFIDRMSVMGACDFKLRINGI